MHRPVADQVFSHFLEFAGVDQQALSEFRHVLVQSGALVTSTAICELLMSPLDLCTERERAPIRQFRNQALMLRGMATRIG